MRTLLLVIFEIAAVFGIPRMINELRQAFRAAPPPVAVAAAVNPVKERPAAAVLAKRAAADEETEAKLLKDSLPPSARTVANLQAAPETPLAVKLKPPKEKPAASRNDDYLPPWMRGEGAPKREAKLVPVPVPTASVPKPAAARTVRRAKRTVRPARRVRHRHRRSQRTWNTRRWRPRMRHSRRASRRNPFWTGF